MSTLYIYDGEVDIALSSSEPVYWYSLGNGTVNYKDDYCINDVKRLNEIALELKDEYSGYIYSLNDLFLQNGFIIEDRVSAYFISDLSNKRTETFDTYLSVCHLTLIKERMKSIAIDNIVFNGCSRNFVVATKSLYPKCNITTEGIIESSTNTLKQIKSQAYFFISALAKVAVFYYYNFKNPRVKEIENLFLTRFPLHFDKNNQEGKYGNLVTLKDYYLISVLTDGMHQNLKLRVYMRNVRLISSELKNAILLDSYLRLKDVIVALINSLKFQYYRIILAGYSYNFNDIDISGFISLELDQSFIRIPRLIMYRDAIKTVFENYCVNNFVYYLHEFCYGRYFTYILKTFFSTVTTIGFQHGPLSRRKLLYHLASEEPDQGENDFLRHLPMPDKVLAEDSHSAKVYTEVGYSNVSIMKEIYRLEYLKHINRRNVQADTKLVALGLHDGQKILNFLRKEIIENRDKKYILKVHPRSGRNNSIIKRVRELNAPNIEIGVAPISEYLSFVSEVIVSYSSVGLEAHMLGIPTRLIQLPNKINESPLLDMQELNLNDHKDIHNLEHKISMVRDN